MSSQGQWTLGVFRRCAGLRGWALWDRGLGRVQKLRTERGGFAKGHVSGKRQPRCVQM